jgi:hypothetical protein
MKSDNTNTKEQKIKRASNAAMASILNLTFLPGLGFIWILMQLRKPDCIEIERYHLHLGIKVNLIAAFALLVVSGLMILFGGFQSAWTWVYVITYFVFVHTVFIMIAVWALVRAWSGQKLNKFEKKELLGE